MAPVAEAAAMESDEPADRTMPLPRTSARMCSALGDADVELLGGSCRSADEPSRSRADGLDSGMFA